jgi:hypothetical protein
MQTNFKETLRAQYDPRKMMWKIVKKTYNGSGGWKRFGDSWHSEQSDAEAAIQKIINNYPEIYCEG